MSHSTRLDRVLSAVARLAFRFAGLYDRKQSALSASRPAEQPERFAHRPGFVPSRPVVPNAAGGSQQWKPAQASRATAAFARDCTAEAVLAWYTWFLEQSVPATQDVATEPVKSSDSHGSGSAAPGDGPNRTGIPGFPAFQRQAVDAVGDGVRVRFFDHKGEMGGTLWLQVHGDRCTVRVPGGTEFVVRVCAELDDLASGPSTPMDSGEWPWSLPEDVDCTRPDSLQPST